MDAIGYNGYNGGDLQPGCLADRLLTCLGQTQIHPWRWMPIRGMPKCLGQCCLGKDVMNRYDVATGGSSPSLCILVPPQLIKMSFVTSPFKVCVRLRSICLDSVGFQNTIFVVQTVTVILRVIFIF